MDGGKEARFISVCLPEVSSQFFRRTCGSVGSFVVMAGGVGCPCICPPSVVCYSSCVGGTSTLGSDVVLVVPKIAVIVQFFATSCSFLIWGLW